MKTLNLEAWKLRTKIFDLANEIKSLDLLTVRNNRSVSTARAAIEIGSVGAAIARIYEFLPDVFIDAARDPQDQSFRVSLLDSDERDDT